MEISWIKKSIMASMSRQIVRGLFLSHLIRKLLLWLPFFKEIYNQFLKNEHINDFFEIDDVIRRYIIYFLKNLYIIFQEIKTKYGVGSKLRFKLKFNPNPNPCPQGQSLVANFFCNLQTIFKISLQQNQTHVP